MPTYALTAYSFLFPSISRVMTQEYFLLLLLLIFSSTFLLPLLSVFIMVKFGRIRSVYMEDQRERNWPLLQTAIVYAVAFYVLVQAKRIPPVLPLFILGATGAMVVAMIVNLRWKISLHMIGIGGLCGGLTGIFVLLQEGNPIILSAVFFAAGALGTARLLLNAHNPLQILGGFMAGFAIEFGLLTALGN
jgi:membrane-associated phospholipid phosphatase